MGDDKFRDLAERFDGGSVYDFIWMDRSRFCNDLVFHYKNLISLRKRGFSFLLQANMSRNFLTDHIAKSVDAEIKIVYIGERCYDTRRIFRAYSNFWYSNLIETDGAVFEFNINKVFFKKILGKEIHLPKPFFDDPNLGRIGFDFRKYGIDRNFIVITPGSSESWKVWSADNFSKVCNFMISKEKDLKVVILRIFWGNQSRSAYIRKPSRRVNGRLSKKTSVCELTAILHHAKMLIGCDTGAIHIAAALGVPTVCISSIGDRYFGRYLPYPTDIFDRQICIFHPIIESEMHNPSREKDAL